MSNTHSLTAQLLANSEVNPRGVMQSIVFNVLAVPTQDAIRAAGSEGERESLACDAGDQLSAIAQMHADLISGPAERRSQSMAFAQFDNLDTSFVRDMLTESDRKWFRRDGKVSAIKTVKQDQGWAVLVSYADGSDVMVAPEGVHADQQVAQQLLEHIRKTVDLFSMSA